MITADSLSIDFIARGSKEKLKALSNVSFSIKEGEFIALVGPSGCGKSTLLNTIAGFISPSEGSISYKNEKISKASRERVVIFQNHSLFPWKSAADNIAFALRAKGGSPDKIAEESNHFLKLVKLEEFANHYPKELSIGMQQRIGIARALAADPEVLLLDEPFASLDQFTRDMVQEELLKIIRPLKKTAILVTHNINEAVFFADRIFIMSGSPGTIRAIFDVKCEKPTSVSDIDHSEELLKIKREVNSLFKSIRNENNISQ